MKVLKKRHCLSSLKQYPWLRRYGIGLKNKRIKKGPRAIPKITDSSQFSGQYLTCSAGFNTNCLGTWKCSSKWLSYHPAIFSMSAHNMSKYQILLGGRNFSKMHSSYSVLGWFSIMHVTILLPYCDCNV